MTWAKSKIQDRNVIFGPVKTDLDSSKLIWAGPKRFGLVQNHFGPIEGQGTNQFFYKHFDPAWRTARPWGYSR